MKQADSFRALRLIAIDILIAAFVLVNFAYFHHVKVKPSPDAPPVEVTPSISEPKIDVLFSYETLTYESGSSVILSITATTNEEMAAATLFVKYDDAKYTYKSYEAGSGISGCVVSVLKNDNVLNLSTDLDGTTPFIFPLDTTPDDISDNCIALLYFESNDGGAVQAQDFSVTVNPARLIKASNDLGTYSLSNSERILTASGDFREKFPDKFTDGEVIETDTSYQSANVNVSYSTIDLPVSGGTASCHVVDIYVRSYDYFRTSVLYDTIEGGINHAQGTPQQAEKVNAIAAINGDYCSARNVGPVVRNGVIYRTSVFQDIFVMYTDGTMKAYEMNTYASMAYDTGDIWQVWSFGPTLLTANGQVKKEFNSVLGSAHPRSAIGYYEPGHYCFVAVDGRDMGDSAGVTLEEFSQFFYDLGCSAAYNVDGGRTSVAVYNGKTINTPYNGGRACSDIIYIPRD